MVEWFYSNKGKGMLLYFIVNVFVVVLGLLLSLAGINFINNLYFDFLFNSIFQIILIVAIIVWISKKASNKNLNELDAEIEMIKLKSKNKLD